MAFTSEKLQFRRMGFGLNSSREVLRMQHSGNFMLHNDAFTPHLVRIEFGSNRRSVAREIKLCKSTCKRSEIQSRRYPSRASQSSIPDEHPRRESFPSRRRFIAGLFGPYAFALRLPAPCTFVVRKFCRQKIRYNIERGEHRGGNFP